jgi:hypothetical protein
MLQNVEKWALKIYYKEGSKAANLKFFVKRDCGINAYSLCNSAVIYKSRTLPFHELQPRPSSRQKCE